MAALRAVDMKGNDDMRRIAALLAAAFLAVSMTSCGSKTAETETDTTAEESSEAETLVPEEKTVPDTDFIEFCLTGSGTDYFGLSIDDFNEKTGNKYIEQNALEYEPDFGYATFSLGEVSSVLNGRAELGGEFPVTLTLSYKDGRVICVTYSVEKTEADPVTVSDALTEFLSSSLPSDYKGEFDYPLGGKKSARFGNTTDGYVFSVWHFDDEGTGYPVKFSLETYKDKYGM